MRKTPALTSGLHTNVYTHVPQTHIENFKRNEKDLNTKEPRWFLFFVGVICGLQPFCFYSRSSWESRPLRSEGVLWAVEKPFF